MRKVYAVSLSVVCVLFLLLFIMLSYNSRLATDDYYFIGDLKNHGLFEQVYFQYMNWTGRYSATFSTNVLYNIFGLNQIYYNVLPIASLIIIIGGIWLLYKNLFIFLNVKLSSYNVLIFSILTATFLFFLSYDIGETWFWYCSFSSYLWSISAFIWGVACVLSLQHNYFTSILSIICFVYIGGASELYNSIILLFFIVAIYYRKVFPEKIFKNIIIAFVAFLVAFMILIIAPGNYLRDGLFPEHNFIYSFYIVLKSVVKFFVMYLPSRVIYLICFIPVFIAFGQYIKNKISSPFSIPFKKFFVIISIFFIAILLTYFYLVAFVMVETGPPRVMFLVSFLFTCYLVVISIYAGLTLPFKKLSTLKRVSAACSIVMLIFHFTNQSIITSKYANANDERIEYLLALKNKLNKDTLILLDPLPPDGMLYSTEISSDENHFTNREVKMGYDLPFRIAKKESK